MGLCEGHVKRFHFVVGAIHLLRNTISGLSGPPPPPSVIGFQHLAYPPLPPLWHKK